MRRLDVETVFNTSDRYLWLSVCDDLFMSYIMSAGDIPYGYSIIGHTVIYIFKAESKKFFCRVQESS